MLAVSYYAYVFLREHAKKSAWGDADALAEAGYCYAQGIGCKKDLKKSARLYRHAEAKGISMIGNSWYVPVHLLYVASLLIRPRIYKAKYADSADSPKKSLESKSSPEKDKHYRTKSRRRTIFGRGNPKN